MSLQLSWELMPDQLEEEKGGGSKENANEVV